MSQNLCTDTGCLDQGIPAPLYCSPGYYMYILRMFVFITFERSSVATALKRRGRCFVFVFCLVVPPLAVGVSRVDLLLILLAWVLIAVVLFFLR